MMLHPRTAAEDRPADRRPDDGRGVSGARGAVDRGLGAGPAGAEPGGHPADEDPPVRAGAADGRRREVPLQGGVHAQPRRQGAVLRGADGDFRRRDRRLRRDSVRQRDSARRVSRRRGASREPIRLVVAPGVDVGMIYVFAVGSIAVYGVVLGGWASNNKYSFLGGLRSGAQLISYELPLGLGILGVVLADRLAAARRDHRPAGRRPACGTCFAQPLGFVVFCVAAFAEAARLPFDLPEAEQELVGGYHTEYSGIKLMMYLVAEFLHMITAAFLIVILFLGGWHFWGLTGSGDDVDLAGGRAAGDRAAGQGDGRDPVLHARPLELAAVPLRPIDGHRLEGDDSLGAGEPGGGGRVDGIRRPRWPPAAGLPARRSMAAVGLDGAAGLPGWSSPLADPTAADNRPLPWTDGRSSAETEEDLSP